MQTDDADHKALRHELAHMREREAAMREILNVMSQSRDDEGPVFNAIIHLAERLCHAEGSGMQLLNAAGTHLHIVASGSWDDKGSFPIGTEFDLSTPLGMCIAVREARVVHVEDMMETELYKQGHEGRRRLVDVEGVHTHLCVPLVRNGKAFGNITLSRREQKAFSPDEIALVETFAAQAVIAIDNVRQFREVQTRLEREQASREILQVISASRTDPAPVFDVILRNAAHLSGTPLANLCLLNPARSHWHLVAHIGDGLRHLAVGKTATPLESGLVPAVAIRTARIVHIEDLTDTDLYRQGDPGRVAMVDEEGMRTILCVPLLSEAGAIGCITLFRREVKAFTRDEIALVETFAAQAVIAIENVRQFRELQTRLERERATSEVLQVISRSRDNETPVFDAILRHAETLCRAPVSALILAEPDDATQTLAAHRGARPQAVTMFETGQMPMDVGQSYTAKCIIDGEVVAFRDMGESDLYKAGSPVVRSMVDDVGVRSVIFAPLIRDGRAIGAVTVYRKGVDPFDDTEIALLKTFAAQAVIAIENVRQFRALETLNVELEDRVEKQVGEIERMGKLKRFLPAAVADTVVSSGSDKLLRSHRALLGVLFCDIRGFTAFCETAEPEETIEVLQQYHEEMGKLINAHGAGVDHRMGDGIMVLFNDPLPCDDPAGDAVRLAIAMRGRMAELCSQWKRMGYRLGFGVGASLGYATVGMVGFEGRFDYTASGTAINLASRLCDEAADGEILLSPRAAIAVEDAFRLTSTGEIILKGIREPVEVFRLRVGAGI